MRRLATLVLAACSSGSGSSSPAAGSNAGSNAGSSAPPPPVEAALPAGPAPVALAPLDRAQLRTMTRTQMFLVIDAHGARRFGRGIEITGATPYAGDPLERGTSPTAVTREEGTYEEDRDSYGVLSKETTTTALVLADAATPARVTLRDGIQPFGWSRVALAAGAANSATLYRFGADPSSAYPDLALRVDHLEALAGQHPQSVLLEIPDDATTGQLIAALGTLSAAGVTRVELHRMMGWGGIPVHTKLSVSDGNSDRMGDLTEFEIAEPHVDGGLSAHGVQSALVGYVPRFRFCVEQAKRPPKRGNVKLAFDVTAGGEIRGAKATGLDAKIASCIAGSIFDLDITPRAIQGAGHATVAMAFHPRGDGTASEPATPTSGFWCFAVDGVGLCARLEEQCSAALGGFNQTSAAVGEATAAACQAQETAWTRDGKHFQPTKASCGASCREVR